MTAWRADRTDQAPGDPMQNNAGERDRGALLEGAQQADSQSEDAGGQD